MNKSNTVVLAGLVIFLIIILTVAFNLLKPKAQPATEISPTPLLTNTPTSDTQPTLLLDSPLPESKVSSPLVITGEARGTWYFEATLPVSLVREDKSVIAEGFVSADGEWMTENLVPFSGRLEFTPPASGEKGFLILRKANPSGLPENDDAVEIPVLF